MNDSGSGGDSVASDGIWSAQILDQGADNRIVQFYVKASSKNGQEVTLPSRGQNVPAMYVVDDDQIETDVTSYRWVVSEYDRRSLSAGNSAAWDWKFPNLSNSYKKMTLIVDETEIFTTAKSGRPVVHGTLETAQILPNAENLNCLVIKDYAVYPSYLGTILQPLKVR